MRSRVTTESMIDEAKQNGCGAGLEYRGACVVCRYDPVRGITWWLYDTPINEDRAKYEIERMYRRWTIARA